MRSYEDAAKYWPELSSLTSLSDLKTKIKDPRSDYPSIQGLRSAFWKVFLLFENLDQKTWPKRLQNSRAAYTSLRAHLLRAIEHPDELDTTIDPLSESEESPWAALRQDEALRAEILQDVDRCMPENLYFRQPATQKMLLDILFVFSKLNPDVSYRQGMHELLAPVLWVVERDAIAQDAPRRGQNHEIFAIFDSNYIEHDTFTLFGLIMQSAKSFYDTASIQGSGLAGAGEATIVLLCRRIFEDYLPRVDPELASHLHEIAILPQVFLMRWARLLFGREFCFDSMLEMWDVIFAEDPTLTIVDLICIVMLLRIRWQLIEADYSTALTLLLRYPEPESNGAKSFVTDAIFLKTHFHSDGGSHIVHKYSGRHLPHVSQAGAMSESPDIPFFTVTERSHSPSKNPQQASQAAGLEGLLQDAARGVFKRGEKWGVNQAVRDAVGEVRRNVQGLQSGKRFPQRKGSDAPRSTDPDQLLRRISRLEARNRALAKMLEGAVAELWDHQKSVSEGDKTEDDSVDALSMAVARVQLVQVYLEDSSMAVPEDESQRTKSPNSKETSATPASSSSSSSQSPKPIYSSETPITNTEPTARSSFPKAPNPTSPPPPSASHPSPSPSPQTRKLRPKPTPVPIAARPTANQQQTQPPATAPSTQATFPSASSPPLSAPNTNLNVPRPSLAHSSFSWMLGPSGDRRASSFVSARPFPAEKRRQGAAGKDFLFGEEDEIGVGSTGAGRGGGGKGKSGVGGRKGSMGAEEERREVFDLGELEKGGGSD